MKVPVNNSDITFPFVMIVWNYSHLYNEANDYDKNDVTAQ